MSGEKKKKEKFKVTFDAISCWGGAVVIIGSMFKILHLKGATVMITIGLTSEALLFFLSGFRPVHKDPEWTRVYPQLAEDYVPEAGSEHAHVSAPAQVAPAAVQVPAPALVSTPAPVSAVVTSPVVVTNSIVGGMGDMNVSPETIQKLGEGLKNFSEQVSQISNVSEATVATAEFTTKIKDVSSSFDKLSESFRDASDKMSDVATASVDSAAYREHVTSLTKNLSALNALYELELQESGEHLKSMTTFYQTMSASMKNLSESVVDSTSFKEEVSKLSRNLSSLNAVYGNMLSAVNQPRS